MKTVTAQYFAVFREQAGVASEAVATEAVTAAELFELLASRHGFADAQSRCKVAINDDLADWNAPLADGDRVLFFPPVAGG